MKNLGPRFFLKTALIVLLGGWVFSPAFHGAWLWDDKVEITENPALPGALWKIWFAPASLDFFPLKATVQWIQWRLWHEAPLGYHLSSIGLHLLDALLLWHLLKRLGLRLAWLGGLLFAIHPLTVESVAWISELKNTLSLAFLLPAMGAWLDFGERGRRVDYLRALLFFLAAMLCKSSVVMFPAVLLLHAWWKQGRITRTDLKTTAAFFAVSLALGLVTVWFQHQRAIGPGSIPELGFFPRLAGAGLAISFYFFKSVCPSGLLPVYSQWMLSPLSVLHFLPWPVLGAVFYGLWRRRETWGRHALFGGGCFLLNLAPVLGFITMAYMHIARVADHFAYLSLVGLIGLATAGAGMMEARLSAFLRPYACGGAALVLGLFAFQSHRLAGIFHSEETLWAYTVQRNPQAWLAHGNLGNALLLQNKITEAMGHFEEALRLKPDYAEAYNNLGNALDQAGRTAEALGKYQRALELGPANAVTHYNLGCGLARLGRVEEAMKEYREALRLNPGYAMAHNNLGNVLLSLGRVDEAILEHQETLRLKPNLAEVHNNLGYALTWADRPGEAIAHFEQALRLSPSMAEVHGNWGNALVRLGRLPEAIAHFRQCLRLRPDLAAVHDRLGTTLARLGRFEEAMMHFEEAVRLKPDFAEARGHLENLRLQVPPPAVRPENQTSSEEGREGKP